MRGCGGDAKRPWEAAHGAGSWSGKERATATLELESWATVLVQAHLSSSHSGGGLSSFGVHGAGRGSSLWSSRVGWLPCAGPSLPLSRRSRSELVWCPRCGKELEPLELESWVTAFVQAHLSSSHRPRGRLGWSFASHRNSRFGQRSACASISASGGGSLGVERRRRRKTAGTLSPWGSSSSRMQRKRRCWHLPAGKCRQRHLSWTFGPAAHLGWCRHPWMR